MAEEKPDTDTPALLTWCEPWARCIDRVRLIPRLIAAGYGYLVWRTWEWATGLETISMEQAGFASAVFAMTGFIFKFYYGAGTARSDSN